MVVFLQCFQDITRGTCHRPKENGDETFPYILVRPVYPIQSADLNVIVFLFHIFHKNVLAITLSHQLKFNVPKEIR